MQPQPMRAREQGAALAFILIVNWLLAHVATDWVLPPEIAQAAQTLFSFLFGSWVDRLNRKADAKAAALQTVLASPDPRKPSDQESAS